MARRYIRILLGIIKELEQKMGGKILGAEVGVWRGNNASHFLKSFPELILYLIDSYEEESLEWNGLTVGQSKPSAEQAFRGLFPYRNRCRWLLLPSIEAAKLVPDRSLDYCIIDADHRYPAVKSDIVAWRLKVREGGVFAGDDYECSDVKRAVEEEFGRAYNKKGPIWWVEL